MNSYLLTSIRQEEIQMLEVMHSAYAHKRAQIGLSDPATELYDSEDNIVMI